MPQPEPELILNEQLGKTKPDQLVSPNNGVGQNEPHSSEDQNRGTGPLAHLGQSEFRAQADIDLLRNALARHGRFPIPLATRAEAAVWLAEVASSKRYDGRARVNAVKALADLDRINMEQELRDAGGQVQRVDITSGGKPLGAVDYSKLTAEELERLIAERERQALPPG